MSGLHAHCPLFYNWRLPYVWWMSMRRDHKTENSWWKCPSDPTAYSLICSDCISSQTFMINCCFCLYISAYFAVHVNCFLLKILLVLFQQRYLWTFYATLIWVTTSMVNLGFYLTLYIVCFTNWRHSASWLCEFVFYNSFISILLWFGNLRWYWLFYFKNLPIQF